MLYKKISDIIFNTLNEDFLLETLPELSQNIIEALKHINTFPENEKEVAIQGLAHSMLAEKK